MAPLAKTPEPVEREARGHRHNHRPLEQRSRNLVLELTHFFDPPRRLQPLLDSGFLLLPLLGSGFDTEPMQVQTTQLFGTSHANLGNE